MKKVYKRALVWSAWALLVGALAVVAAGCGGDSKKSTSTKAAGPNLPTSIGKGEGKLSLIAWEGYTQPEWVKPFEKQTGCKEGKQGFRDLIEANGLAAWRQP